MNDIVIGRIDKIYKVFTGYIMPFSFWINQRFVMLPDKTCIEFFVTNLVIYCFNSHGFLLSFFYAVVKINQWQAFNDFCRPEKNYSPPKLAITTNDLNNN